MEFQVNERTASTASVSSADRRLQILMADDDRNEQLLALLAADEAGIQAEFSFVDDGTQLLMALNQRLDRDELPDLVLLDLRMPILDGHRTLAQLQSHPVLWQVPVVVFSSSTRREDHEQSFRKGARWFETKPSEFSGLVDFIKTLPDRAAHSHYEVDPSESSYDRGSTTEEIDLTEFDL